MFEVASIIFPMICQWWESLAIGFVLKNSGDGCYYDTNMKLHYLPEWRETKGDYFRDLISEVATGIFAIVHQ